MRNDFFKHILLSGGSKQNRTELETETLPYTFTSDSYKLRNYRIYGNTVNEESVGDLVTEGEHSGKYLVPVTVAGKNLFDISTVTANAFINVNTGVVTPSSTANSNVSDFIPVLANANYIFSFDVNLQAGYTFVIVYYDEDKTYLQIKSNYNSSSNVYHYQLAFTPTNNGFIRIKYSSNSINMQVEKGSSSTPYEPYQTPVTTNLYLPEQIKMVGDEAEYIDYGEQKQHRVRKNLFDFDAFVSSITETASGGTTSVQGQSITLTANEPDYYTYPYLGDQSGVYKIPVLPNAKYILSWEADNNKNGRIYVFLNGSLSGAQTVFQTEKSIKFATQDDTTYATIRFGVYSAGDSITYSNIQLNKGSTVLPYEPYIENTDLDVTLPALPTLKGTNVLSVGTEVQPSKVYLQGKISEAEIVSAEPVQTNVQSLQPISLDENAELDVMPSDKNEFQTNDISEMPVEDENSIEEILETENLETTGDDENAE